MKKNLLFIVLLFFSINIFSQKNISAPPVSKQDYLQKSKRQKNTAWILLGSGVGLAIATKVFPQGKLERSGYFADRYSNDGLRTGFALAGFSFLIVSPFIFEEAKKNKRKAMAMGLKMNTAPQIQNNSIAHRQHPSLNLKISL